MRRIASRAGTLRAHNGLAEVARRCGRGDGAAHAILHNLHRSVVRSFHNHDWRPPNECLDVYLKANNENPQPFEWTATACVVCAWAWARLVDGGRGCASPLRVGFVSPSPTSTPIRNQSSSPAGRRTYPKVCPLAADNAPDGY